MQTNQNTAPEIDASTGLLNYAALVQCARATLTTARTNQTCAFLILNLDALMCFNDTFGHTRGDKVLRKIAVRFAEVLPEGAILSRCGGEFVVFLPNLTDPNAAKPLAQMMEETLQAPFYFDDQMANLSVSSGTALFPRDGDTFEALFEHADEAMWTAKAPKHEARKSQGDPFTR